MRRLLTSTVAVLKNHNNVTVSGSGRVCLALMRGASEKPTTTATMKKKTQPAEGGSMSFQMYDSEGDGGLLGFVKEEDKKLFAGPSSARLPCESEKPPPQAIKAAKKLGEKLPFGPDTTKSSGSMPVADRRANRQQPSAQRCEAHPRNHVNPEDEKDVKPADLKQDLPYQNMSKEEMWTRLREAGRQQELEQFESSSRPSEVDYLKIEMDLKEDDRFHWRIGQECLQDPQLRRDYYAMQALALGLNKSRWKQLEVQTQKGTGSMGAALRAMFWKEAAWQVINTGKMASGQFVDGHPVLRPFADSFNRHQFTKTFLRGFVDARLKAVNQPGNMKQLLDLFDKSYGFFFASQLELLGLRDEHAEHVVSHIGRAVGLTQHSVLYWRKYANLGVTMIPSDVCADNKVSLGLLKHQSLAIHDRGVRRCLYDIMCQVKAEMDHVRDLIHLYPTQGWPLLFEAFLPNYYLKFLLKNDFNVQKWHSEDRVHSAGFLWYAYKKQLRWKMNHDLQELVSEEAPLPGLGLFTRKTNYPAVPINCSRGGAAESEDPYQVIDPPRRKE